MLGSYRVPYTVPFQYGTVYRYNVVQYRSELWSRCGTVAAAVHFEWIVLVLTKLVKSVKCHTLPSLRRDMDNEIVIHYVIDTLCRWKPQPGRR